MPARRPMLSRCLPEPRELPGGHRPLRNVTIRRRTVTTVACALASVLAAGLAAVAPLAPAQAVSDGSNVQSEAYRLGTVEGQSTGSATHLVGDYAIYTSVLGSAVNVAHWVGPNTSDWETATLSAPEAGMRFGTSVRLDEDADRAFVSARDDKSAEVRVYVYVRSGANTWDLDATLSPEKLPDRVSSYTGFGESLDVQGNRLAVGVPNATVDAKATVGFVFVVDLASHTWMPLIPASVVSNADTGQSVALDGDRLAVGAAQYVDSRGERAGGVYLWDLANPTAEPLFTVQPEAPHVCLSPGGAGGPAFGISLGFSDGVLYVGSPDEIDYAGEDPASTIDGCTESAVDAGNTSQGAVYRLDSQLKQIGPKLIAPESGYGFGNSIAVDGDALLVSSDHGPDYQGEVRVFDTKALSTGTGDENKRERVEPVRTLVGTDAASGFGRQYIGTGISVSADRALVGARSVPGTISTAYLFEPIQPEAAITLAVADTTIEYGQRARLQATVSEAPARDAAAHGATGSAATNSSTSVDGSVTFSVDGVPLPAVPVAGGKAHLDLAVASHNAGPHQVLATYSTAGGKILASAESKLVVRKASTSTALLAKPGRVTVGDTVTLTGKVKAEHGTIPTGSVAIVVDGTKVGEAALDAGTYRWTLATRTAGTLSLRAEYPGDANHQGSAAKDSTVKVVAASDPATPTITDTATGKTPGPDASGPGNSGRLPRTGAWVLPSAVGAVVLLAAGAGTLVLSRRRRS